jgi:GABA permease
MAFIPDQRTPLLFGLISLGILLLAFAARARFGAKADFSMPVLEPVPIEES